MAGQVKAMTDGEFEQKVLGSSNLSLVDFWAEWCGPCRMLAPTIEKLADEYSGKVEMYKLNVDENPNTPARYQVRGIPTVILFKDGEPVEQLVGNQPKEAYANAIAKYV